MDIDQVTRTIAGAGRRQALAGLFAGAAALGTQHLAMAKKKKKKKTCKKPKALTCQQACGGGTCTTCYVRANDSILCGAAGSTFPGCEVGACTSDQDCVGTNFPYCVAQYERLSDGFIGTTCLQNMATCIAFAACPA